MNLHVDVEPIGSTLFKLVIRDGDQVIGEYERSQAQHIERKKSEIAAAAEYLLERYRLHGPFIVRWDGASHAKVVKDETGNQIGKIPPEHWRDLPTQDH